MPDLPTGTVTFLFTDIEGSTRLLQELGDRYADVLAEYRQLLRAAFQEGDGHEIDTAGDACFVAFRRARDAVATTVAAQRAITRHPWPKGKPLRVRMGLHTGEPTLAAGGYIGLDVHRAARICGAGWGGQILLSQTTRDLVEHELPEGASLRDLGKHRLKDLQRPEQVFQLLHTDLAADFPRLNSLDTLPNNLPRQLTSFVGREREMADVTRLLSTTRLLTLTGAGGCGKTRLALQVAAELLEDYAHGVWVVELAALSDPALVPQAVASTLGVREEPGRPLPATLVDYLQLRHVLLVLDNCEHLVAACAQLVEALLRACPNLRVLATGREALRIAGEAVWRVPSLSLPDPQHLLPIESVTQYEAIYLFIERALFSHPGFAVTQQNAQVVAQICHRLDGIPLAIELAAARMHVLSVEQIATRLDDRFRLLVAGSRTALPRHQTLRATMDWSYDLLAEPERMLLRRLSVFAGGFTLEAVEAVCAGDGLSEADVLDLLANLADKSLVLVEEQGDGVRYRLLETVRQYGHDKLVASGEAGRVRTRHRDWYLGLAEQAEPELQGPEQGKWLQYLETEHGNLRGALEWSMEHSPEVGMHLAADLGHFWNVRGHLSEGRERLAVALSRAETSGHTEVRAKALNAAGRLALHQSDYAAARALYEESLAIFRTLEHQGGIASVLNNLGRVAFHQGDYASTRARHEESLAIYRTLGDKAGIATALVSLGDAAAAQGDYARARVLQEEGLAIRRELGDRRSIANSLNTLGIVAASQGDYATAHTMYEESLAIYRELGNRRGIAIAVNNLGVVAWSQGDYATAHTMYEESLAIYRELGDKGSMAGSLTNLGSLAYREGDRVEARALYKESLGIFRDLGDKRNIAETLEGLARVAGAQGQATQAARWFGAAEALREAIVVPLLPSERADYDHSVDAVRAAMEETGFAAAWAKGRVMPLEQAISEALDAPAQA